MIAASELDFTFMVGMVPRINKMIMHNSMMWLEKECGGMQSNTGLISVDNEVVADVVPSMSDKPMKSNQNALRLLTECRKRPICHSRKAAETDAGRERAHSFTLTFTLEASEDTAL